MEATKNTDDKSRQTAEPIYLESTLLRVFGVLFCHDPKRARSRTGKLEMSRGVLEKGITVRFDPEYAQPGPFAHKVAMAVIRKQSRFGRPAQKTVSFSQRELMRMMGRTSMGGRQSEELSLALKQIRYSHVLAHFKKDDHFVEHDFSVFNEVLIERRASPTDPIAACTIVIADPIIQSLNDKHFTCLNHVLMQQLGTIGTALYMRLVSHFATIYDGNHLDRVIFKKRYDDICAEWLGGIAVHKYRSIILAEQLGAHLDQLVAVGFLRSYALTPAEGRDGLVLTFRAGERFREDYKTFYTRRAPGKVRFSFHEETRTIGDPHQVAYQFIERRIGQKPDANAYVSSKDVETAKHLLSHLDMAQIPDFLDYALAEARKTRFELQTLGGVRQYLGGYRQILERRNHAKGTSAAHVAEHEQEEQRLAYDRYRRAEAEQLLNDLSTAKRSSIAALARANLTANRPISDYMAKTLIRVEMLRLAILQSPNQIASYEQWLVSQLA